MSEPRRFAGDTLVVATHNPGKAREIGVLLRRYVAHCPTAGELGVPEPEETESTFIGNAVLKAKAVALATGQPALADDSGLAVVALGGAPGIYSARWAGPAKDFAIAMRRVLAELGDHADRGAAFVCALALAWPDGHVEVVEGRVEGAIAAAPSGTRGFGYDPLFVPAGRDITFGEMDPAEKLAMSHRADAFAKLIARCFRADM